MKIKALGHALSLFLLVSYVICIGWGLVAPDHLAMHSAWAPILPGFEWLTLSGFLIGLVESYAYGWYVALLFVPLYNRFSQER